VRFRLESFGYIAYRGATNWIAIDATLYAVLTATLRNVTTIQDVVVAYQSSEDDALETLSMLKAKGIVEVS